MSDEEKEAIEYWKTHMKILHWNTQLASEYYIKVLLDLIDKQQKEIEELKENNGYHLGFIDGGIAKRYEYEDKIKAKIEELEKLDFGTDLVSQFTANLTTITILQSLLEKE